MLSDISLVVSTLSTPNRLDNFNGIIMLQLMLCKRTARYNLLVNFDSKAFVLQLKLVDQFIYGYIGIDWLRFTVEYNGYHKSILTEKLAQAI